MSREAGEIQDHGERSDGGRKDTSISSVYVCVWRKSRKLLTGRYAEREISMITQTERGEERISRKHEEKTSKRARV